MTPKQALERGRHFFGTRVWLTRLEHAGRWRALLYRISRALYATARGFREKDLTARAAALTYYSVLSIVPFLAFAFSLFKGFGVYNKVMEQVLRPYLRESFADNKPLLTAMEQIVNFVARTSVTGLSVIGVLLLLYTSITMLSSVERAMNDVWEARRSRPLLRKVTDYTTLMVIGPLLIVAAIGLGAAAQSSTVAGFLHKTLPFGGELMLSFTSVVLGCVALVSLYIIMPNVQTRLSSALFGGIVAGVLWQGALLVHVKSQMGVAKYNALYSGFAAVPIFLVWLYVSWTIVLIGAQLAAGHQYEKRIKDAVRARHADQELREMLAVVLTAAVSRRFLEGRPPATSAALAEALDVPLTTVEDVLEALVRAGVIVRVIEGESHGYDPGRDVDAVRMADVEEATRIDPRARPLKDALGRSVGPALSTLLRSRRDAALKDSGSLTLRQLASQCLVQFEAVKIETRPAADSAALLDHKQPGVPA